MINNHTGLIIDYSLHLLYNSRSNFIIKVGNMSSSMFFGTWYSAIPPLIAIILAFVTKEVYSSLFIGILMGAFLYANFNPWDTFYTIFSIMEKNIDIKVIIFTIILGMIAVLLKKSGGSKAYGQFALQKLKTKKSSLFATALLGIIIFIDDYFNCLTIGSVMRPVTDKNKISRAKLAYLIDSTTAPICIIAPISSWAAVISSYVPKESSLPGFQLFIKTIPYNLYAFLTIFTVLYLIFIGFDFGLMEKHERNAEAGDLFTDHASEFKESENEFDNPRGNISDLVFPIIILVLCSVGGMIYTGFLNGGLTVLEAFSKCDSPISLVFGTFVTMIVMFFYYIPRKVLNFKEYTDSFTEGFKAMSSALLILTLAWTLKGITIGLGLKEFISASMTNNILSSPFTPLLLFITSVLISFSTGTSWGTFAIMIPLAVLLFNDPSQQQIMIISVSAILAGSVCGDHISPISDTTIMSSAGAQCYHMNHVSTQMQYATIPIIGSFIGYIVAGYTKNWSISLLVGIIICLLIIHFIKWRKESQKATQSTNLVVTE